MDKQAEFCLGTVQFGLHYGISNHSGRPSQTEVFSLLDQALSAGIDCWDTAFAYGEAENVLGEYIRQRRCAGRVRVVSKLRPDFVDTLDKGHSLDDLVRSEVEASLRRLGVGTLEAFMLHRFSHLEIPGMDDALQNIRSSGLARQVGVSVYEAAEAMAVLRSEWADAVQVPYSIIDRRLDKAGFFSRLPGRHRPLRVYARSVLLQGLIVMNDELIPGHLSGIRPYLRELDSILGRYGLNRFDGAVRYVLAHDGVGHLVFGVDTGSQLDDYLRVREAVNDLRPCWEECLNSFGEVDHDLLSPNLWESMKKR